MGFMSLASLEGVLLAATNDQLDTAAATSSFWAAWVVWASHLAHLRYTDTATWASQLAVAFAAAWWPALFPLLPPHTTPHDAVVQHSIFFSLTFYNRAAGRAGGDVQEEQNS